MGPGIESAEANRKDAPRSTAWVALRTTVVWDGLSALLPQLGADRWVVIDAGGGTGGLAVPLAELGHEVVVVDPSPDSLAALERRAGDSSVAARVRWVQGDLGQLGELAEKGSLPHQVDLVLCHSVLEYADEPWAGLEAAVRLLRPGGVLSIVVATRGGAVIARALSGQFGAAAEILESYDSRGSADTVQRRFDREPLLASLATLGLSIDRVHGIRVLSDIVPGGLLDSDPSATRRLLELERALSARPEFLDVATQLHVLARKD